MSKKNKSIGSKPIGNRTIIGIICIVIALIICFGAAPVINTISNGKTEVVRVATPILEGTLITKEHLKIEAVGSHNVPANAITSMDEIVGKYAKSDMYQNDYIFSEKLTTDVTSASDMLEGLNGNKKAISVSISSYATGLSGKLQTGDIVSIIVYSDEEGECITPKELKYVMVITSTTSQGVDKADIKDNSQPATVTLLVNQTQAELLAQYERSGRMHFTLEYRGDSATAQKFLDKQEAVFGTKVGE